MLRERKVPKQNVKIEFREFLPKTCNTFYPKITLQEGGCFVYGSILNGLLHWMTNCTKRMSRLYNQNSFKIIIIVLIQRPWQRPVPRSEE